MQELKKLALCGLIHCDYNEFNIMMHLETLKVTVIDFPQMVSIHHPKRQDAFRERDVECLHKFFLRRYGYDAELDVMGEPDPDFDEILKEVAEKEERREVGRFASQSKRVHLRTTKDDRRGDGRKRGKSEGEGAQ